MKVAVLGTRGFPNVQGGVESHCENLYPYLVQNGCDITVFTRKPYINPSINEFMGVKLISISCPKNKFLEAFLHTLKGIFYSIKLKPDILHIHASGPSLFVPLAKLLGMKVVMTSHGPEYTREKWKGFPKYVLLLGEWCGLKFSDLVISISQENTDRLKRQYKKEIYTISNGVNFPEILKSKNVLDKFRLEKSKYILSVGRFVPEKGFLDLIHAFELFKKSRISKNKIKLVIVGRADHEDTFSKELIAKAKNTDDVILTGFLKSTPLHEIYSHAGLFVLPSYYEGMPIVLLEALSYGLSCVASLIKANKEIGLDKERYFNPGDIQTLAEKMEKYILNSLSDEEKHNQIISITNRYNWENIANKVLNIYKKAII